VSAFSDNCNHPSVSHLMLGNKTNCTYEGCSWSQFLKANIGVVPLNIRDSLFLHFLKFCTHLSLLWLYHVSSHRQLTRGEPLACGLGVKQTKRVVSRFWTWCQVNGSFYIKRDRDTRFQCCVMFHLNLTVPSIVSLTSVSSVFLQFGNAMCRHATLYCFKLLRTLKLSL
jgi:hypothetical protein